MTEQQFLKDVAAHEMIVLRDDGVYRHIRFKKPGTGCMHFDLITWPGRLCYTGDMGTFVFTRLTDMFEFFRTDREYARRNGRTLAINPGYWAEKVDAADRYDGLEVFNEEKFKRVVLERLIGWIRENRHETTKEDRRDLWDAVMSDVIDADGDSGGYRKQCAAHDFSHYVNDLVGSFDFTDFWEVNFTEYSHRFMWCCYAMAWGIQRYDEAHAS